MPGKDNIMEPIKNNDNEDIKEIKDIEKDEIKKLSDEELEGVAGGLAPRTYVEK